MVRQAQWQLRPPLQIPLVAATGLRCVWPLCCLQQQFAEGEAGELLAVLSVRDKKEKMLGWG